MRAPPRRPSRRSISPQSVGDWLTLAPRLTGIGGLITSFVFWAVTGKAEPAFITAFVGLIAAGQGVDALRELRQPPDLPPERDRL